VSYELIKQVRLNSLYADKSLLIVGGVHPSIYPEHTLLDMQVDLVIIGQGETVFKYIINQYPNIVPDQLPGAYFREADQICHTAPHTIMTKLDSLPFPARHLIDEDDLILNSKLDGKDVRMGYIMISRGCPSHCRFCGVLQRKVQYRSGANVRQEILQLIHDYDIEAFAIIDDNFTASASKTLDICQAIADLNLPWSALCRIDSINTIILQTMKKSGCKEIKLGVESGSDVLLKAMGKNLTAKKIKQAIELCQQTGLAVKIFLMHGFPGENLASTDETIALINSIKDSILKISLTRFVPLPGSYVFDHPDKFQLHIEPELNGNYDRCFMYNNHHHWWGSDSDFEQLNNAYLKLVDYLKSINLFET